MRTEVLLLSLLLSIVVQKFSLWFKVCGRSRASLIKRFDKERKKVIKSIDGFQEVSP